MAAEPDAVRPTVKVIRSRAQQNTFVPPASPRLPVDCLRNVPLLLTFVVASTATCIGMMASTKLEQPLSVAAPFLAIYLVAYLVPVAPSWMSCSIFPLVTLYSAFYVNNAQIAVALVSQAGVGAVRTFAMAYYPQLRGNFGARCCILQMISIFEGAAPRTDSIAAVALRWVPNMAMYGGVAFGLHKGAIALLGRAFLKDSIFVAGAIMGLNAMLVLQILDGVYNLCFAYPARISFTQNIQRDPLLALSLREFWNSRWDVSVANALRRGVYDPLIHGLGCSRNAAACCTFFCSAVIHLLQFVAWRAPAWACCSVFGFFVIQAVLLEVEKALRVLSWRSVWLRRLWTFGVLFCISPLMTVPLIVVNRTWDEE
jgi:hypothetical protein